MNELSLIVNDLNPDIIAVCKVLPKNHSRQIFPEELKIQGYNEVIHENVRENIGRGSILYVRNNINFKEVKFEPNNGKFEEGLYIELTMAGKEKLLCANIYRRGQSSKENNDNLIEIFNKISQCNYKHTVIMGDFNLNDIDWEQISSQSNDPENYSNGFIECVKLT